MMFPNLEIVLLLLVPPPYTIPGVGGDPPGAVVREGMLCLCLLRAAAFSLFFGKMSFPPFPKPGTVLGLNICNAIGPKPFLFEGRRGLN